VFDLDADVEAIAAHLENDPLLRVALRAHPGIRKPGAWDGFELAVRAILGQQITVKAATTIAGRLAARFGSPLEGHAALERLFPTATQLVSAPIEEVGVIATRAKSIRTLAARTVDGTLRLDPTADPAHVVSTLKTISGIGEWTAQYIAMRALGDRRAEAWRPWRSYAVMLLWQRATDEQHASRSWEESRNFSKNSP
jgi:AraC family transcriptional regulator of adaptative response / DNA-3-methyladenine glycosylase II